MMVKGKKGNGDGGQAPGRSHREGVSVIEMAEIVRHGSEGD